MMSMIAIQEHTDRMANDAILHGTQPLLIESLDQIGPDMEIPSLGSYIPHGWECTDNLFVDSSGFSEIGEAALTQDQMFDTMRERGVGLGYAVMEAGQFQVYVGIYAQVFCHTCGKRTDGIAKLTSTDDRDGKPICSSCILARS